MSKLDNSTLLSEIFKAICNVATRRTTHNFAVLVISNILNNLEQRHEFLKYVKINSNDDSEEIVNISSNLDSIDFSKIAEAVEDIVKLAFSDLKEKAGQYFIKELEENAGEEVISKLKYCGVDLELFMLHQHYLYRQKLREKETKSEI